jgi:chromosome segregation ATPase
MNHAEYRHGPVGALTGVNPQAIIDRYLSDEPTAEIAKSYNITTQRLSQWLIASDEKAWHSAQVARAMAAKDDANDQYQSLKAQIGELRGIEDQNEFERQKAALQLSLSLARERVKSAQWELERLLSRLYGQKQEVTHTHQVTVDAGLVGLASDLLKGRKERVIEHGERSAAIPYIPSDEDGNKQGDA